MACVIVRTALSQSEHTIYLPYWIRFLNRHRLMSKIVSDLTEQYCVIMCTVCHCMDGCFYDWGAIEPFKSPEIYQKVVCKNEHPRWWDQDIKDIPMIYLKILFFLVHILLPVYNLGYRGLHVRRELINRYHSIAENKTTKIERENFTFSSSRDLQQIRMLRLRVKHVTCGKFRISHTGGFTH